MIFSKFSCILFLTSCLLLSANAFADDPDNKHYSSGDVVKIAMGVANENGAKQDLVENELNSCEETHGDTIGTNECMQRAYNEYEDVLQQLYKIVQSSDEISAESKPALEASQQQWEAYRQSFDKVRLAPKDRGTISTIQAWQVGMGQIKQRIKEFAYYLDYWPV